MALLVWLPLNKSGDFENKGLADITVTNNGATYNSSGKIGGCYKVNGALLSIPSASYMEMKSGKLFSFACWAKGATSNGWFIACSAWEILFRTNVIQVYPGGSASNGASTFSGNTTSDLWRHLAFTWDGSNLILYIDGNPQNTRSISNVTFNIASSINFAYSGTRYFNDIRIYDHCLTPQEVKEISKGLVLHYTLDSNDVFEATTNIASSLTPVANNGGWGGMTATKLGNNIYHLKNEKTNASYWSTFVYTLPADCADLTITFSANINNISTSNVNLTSSWIYIGKGNDGLYPTHGTATYTYNQLTEGKTLTWTGTLDNSNRYFVIELWNNNIDSSTTGYIQFDLCNIQIEKKNHATPYTDGIRTGIVYDSSGYNNNGTITGTLTTSTDTPRYDKCSQGNGNVSCSRLTINNPFTISTWIYLPITGTTGSGNELTIGPVNLYKDHDGVDKHTFSITKSDNSITYLTTFYPPEDKWNHLAIVSNGSTLKIYKNGVASTYSISTKDGNTNFSIMLSNNIKLSDFRVYCTALSEDDIKELYNTAAFIDNGGNVGCYGLEELSENIFKLEYLNETARIKTAYTTYEGEVAIPYGPNQTYLASSPHLATKFKPNTRYKFDLWMNCDLIVYNGNNVPGGIVVHYSDGTHTDVIITGNSTNPLGYQHKVYYSNASKSISYIYAYYYINTPAYYRWDSVIIPIETDTKINKTGVIDSGLFRENLNIALICEGDHFDSNQLIEI